MIILLIGGTGQLGSTILRRFPPGTSIMAPSRNELDLGNEKELRRWLRQARPQLIINAAAYTAVDLAESCSEQAFLINARAPGILAQEAQEIEAALIHFSTDYVFDGVGDMPLTEAAPTAPLNVYGHSKLAGEQAIASHCEAYWIFRLSWLYGASGRNFLTTVLRLAHQTNEVRIVDDQWGAPTWTDSVAAALRSILDLYPTDRLVAEVARTHGIYHLTATGATNWNAYARKIVRILSDNGQALALREDNIRPVSSEAYDAPARRPANSRLSCEKIIATFGITLPAWDTALTQCMTLDGGSGIHIESGPKQ